MSLETEIAWAAGFYDGEGTAGCYHRNDHDSYQIKMSVSQKDREVLDRFVRAIGYGKVHGPYLSGTRLSPIYQCFISGVTDIELAFSKLRPFLSSIKTKQLTEAIDLYWETKIG